MEKDAQILVKLAKTIRFLSADGVQAANSGHPGMPMGMADCAAVLWSKFLKFNPEKPDWPGRDRFVLSAGHGSMLLYSLLHLFGYELPLSELKNFRQLNSMTPGHPEFGVTPGVETTTGPLGQGVANGVGMALSARMLGERYSKELFDYTIYGIMGDGDLMEGVASEAASLAGHLALSNIIYIYDDNHISIGGNTEVCFTENVAKRFEAYNWYVQRVDGHDQEAVAACLENAKKEKDRPSIICARTTIGFGSPNKSNTAGVHGSPLGEEELKLAKEAQEWPADKSFFVPEDVAAYCAGCVENGKSEYEKWQAGYTSWSKANPEKEAAYKAQLAKELPADLKKDLLAEFADGKKAATRALSGKAIQVIAKHLPGFVGGSADLEPSNKTLINDSTDVQPGAYLGKNLRFGVREHGMGAVANGLAYDGSWIPYTGTFLVFADYMRPAIRLAALSHLQTLFVFTHDSFYVGEDGPTHQPVETLASLRCIPNLYTFRPADGLETAMCYLTALQIKKSPSALCFTRQGLPALQRRKNFNPDEVKKGAYVLSGEEKMDLVLVATGSEVSLAVEATELLSESGVSARIVSIPCMELFLEQDQSYRESVIPAAAKKVSIEAGVTMGWERIVGSDGLRIGKDSFGASAPAGKLAEEFGFVADSVADKVRAWLK